MSDDLRAHTEGARLAEAIRDAHADLHASVAGIPASDLEATPVVGRWSVRNVSGNLLDWVEIITAVVEERPAPTVNVRDFDAYNAEREALHTATPWPTLLAALDAAIEHVAAAVEPLDDARLHIELIAPWGQPARLRDVVQVIPHHHHEHLAEITPWALREQLRQARARFSAATVDLDRATLESLPVCGAWNWRDLAGHIADWANEGNRRLSAALDGDDGPEPIVSDSDSINAHNATLAAARANDGWQDTLNDLNAALDTMDALIERAGSDIMTLPILAPWGVEVPAPALLRELGSDHIEDHLADATDGADAADAAAAADTGGTSQ